MVYNFNKEMDPENKAAAKEADTEYRYGWFSFTPGCLQVFNKASWVLVAMVMVQVWTTVAQDGLASATQSSIETRFQLTSSQSSWIISAYEVGEYSNCAIAILQCIV